ncbi:ABC transporter ATP-binding protein [Nonomuraea sediminis]|uniref:ABC transporter ATP-binding protein n=1 Tax=Nonomuraea sediminis TaxID=2835864 RepID=UPI001BDD1B61|nr:oligopeptide/dipeptide ABC transporter ATP-binding protein [Nonomuraea sediminis]
MSTLEFRGVSVRVGEGRRAFTAVNRIDLEIPAGQVLGLVGESGSGKSTLARAAAGLIPVGAGQILVDGATPRPGAIQLVFQDPYSSLDPRMTIAASITEALRAGDRTRARSWPEEVGKALDLVGLDPEVAAALPAHLSGGQRQRVALARALASRPSVLVADEITSALDASVQGTVLNTVRSLQRELGLTMLFISHDLAVVRYVSDVVAVMHLGRIVECAPVDDLLDSPRHPYTKMLLDTGEADGPEREAPDPRHPPAGCRFHTQCPSGPLVLPERVLCGEADPHAGAREREHRVACHYAGSR